MASDSNNSNLGYQISLILFVMLWLGFTVAWYMTWKEIDTFRVKAKQATQEVRLLKSTQTANQTDLTTLKKALGHVADKVGKPDSDNATEVMGLVNNELTKYADRFTQGNYSATIIALNDEIQKNINEKTLLQSQIKKQEGTIQALRNQYQEKVVVHQDAAASSEEGMRANIEKSEETLGKKEDEIDEISTQLTTVRTEFTELQEASEALKIAKDAEIKSLEQTNSILQTRLDNLTKISFEASDGLIRWVDSSSGSAWINLGSADKLPEKTTFSVYEKRNRGIARNENDIKGSIEVTRILGPHLSQVQITSSKLGRPISKGDVIYTPVWQPGRKEYFTLVGKIDIDNDGRDDSKLLIQLIKTAGGDIDNHVTEKGELVGNGISVNTKFIIRGQFPDLAGIPPQSPRALEAQKIGKLYNAIEKDSRKYAVRIVNLTDFLSYIGYKPRRHLYTPGDSRKFTLKSGARSPSTEEAILGRESSGQVSGRFNPRKTYGNSEASGQTSGSFKN